MTDTAYSAIAANRRRSAVLIVVFCIFAVLVGWAISYLLQSGPGGVAAAGIIGLVMALTG